MCARIDYDLWEFEELLESMQCDVNNIGVIIIVQKFPYLFFCYSYSYRVDDDDDVLFT